MHVSVGLERVFGWLLQTTWQAAVIAGIILLAQLLLRRRLSPAWRCGLWFLLLARLLMPMAPRSALSVFNLVKWPVARPARAAVGALPLAPALPSAPAASLPANLAAPPPAPAPAVQPAHDLRPVLALSPSARPAVAASLPPSLRPINWLGLAAWVWLAGAVGLALRSLCANRRFRRRLARCPELTAGPVAQLLGQCAQALGVNGRVQLVETAQVDSPAVYGFWRKRLLLPQGLSAELSPDELRHVLRHELAHVKRRDPEVNGVLALLQVLHWFNPALWFAFARVRADRELATDDLALAHAQRTERCSYGETILKVLEGLTQRRALPGLVGIGESKSQLRARIRAIARGSVGPRGRWAAAGVAAVIAGVALTNAREERQAKGVNLLEKYPTTLTAGDAEPEHARAWRFTPADVFQLSRFTLEVGKALRVETGVADLAIGHCADGAVWAVVLPREGGKLTSSAAKGDETVAHVWLRFHPKEISRLFPAETVSTGGRRNLERRIRTIADAKFTSSWQAGGQAMIPEPKDLTVDADTHAGPRRFFVVDTQAKTAEYVDAFAGDPAPEATPQPEESEVDTNCAQVVSVSPPDGAEDVEPVQDLRIRFDRPMDPHHLNLEWQAGGFHLNGGIQTSADGKEFIIPVRLTAGEEQKLAINHDPIREMQERSAQKAGKRPPRARGGSGFQDAERVAANEFRWSFQTKAPAATPGASEPRVAQVTPASGATTPVLTLLEITFDQPMRPPEQGFPYLRARAAGEGPHLMPNPEYDAAAHRFTLPALLRPDDDVRLTIEGFSSAAGVACAPVVLHLQTDTASLDAKYVARARAAAKDAMLQKLFASMKEARARLSSGTETVQTISLSLEKSAFKSIEAQTATFKWQGPDQVYADISGPMSASGAFILGCDGQNCWLYSDDGEGKKRLDQTPAASAQRDVRVLDPFGLVNRSVEDALAGANVVLASNAKLDGRSCYRLEKWDVAQEHMVFATQTQWWIDEETFLPRQIVQYHPYGGQIVRFDYQKLNERLPDSAFQPPAGASSDAQPLFFTKEPRPDEQRFLHISDGSNGRMAGRIGWQGPRGRTSSGLN